MAATLQPADHQELGDLVAAAAADGSRLRIRGGGSKDAIGAPTPEVATLDMGAFTGVVDYDPPELVITAQAATPLVDIEELVAAQGQMLAFEPFDHGPMLGERAGRATIGGVVAAGVAGSRRLSSGGTRDHVLGFSAVSGDGKQFKAGSRVVKNVTGFDLSKLIAGSWGRLVAVTELTLKVLPRPEVRQSIAVRGLDPATAVTVMARALGSAAGVAAAAHLPNHDAKPMTLFRLEGFPQSVDDRSATLESLLRDAGTVERLDSDRGDALWTDIREATSLPPERPLWRVVTAPGQAPALLEALRGADWYWDWAGGLTWAAGDLDANALRAAATAAGGHATLLRSDAPTRAAIPTFQPRDAAVAAMETSICRAFDPAQVFDCGRF